MLRLRKLDRLNEEITRAERVAHNAKLHVLDVEEALNFAEHVILKAAGFWTEFSPAQKPRLQRALFSKGVTFPESGFGTTATSMIFKLLQQSDARCPKDRVGKPSADSVEALHVRLAATGHFA
jgi:hypothetical protein